MAQRIGHSLSHLGFGGVQLGVPNFLLLGERLGYGLPNGVGDNRLQIVVFGDVRRNQLPLPYDAGNQLLIDSVLLFPEADSFADWDGVFV